MSHHTILEHALRQYYLKDKRRGRALKEAVQNPSTLKGELLNMLTYQPELFDSCITIHMEKLKFLLGLEEGE